MSHVADRLMPVELEASETAPGGSSRRTLSVVLLALLSLCTIAPIWAANRFPSQNGPWFLLPTHMFLHYGDAQWNYSEFFVRNWHPIPHMLHDALVGLVSLVLPLFTAEKVALTLNALLLPLSIYSLLSVVAPRNRILALLAFPMVLSYPFFRGYHDFTLSVSLFFFSFAYWMKYRHQMDWRRVVPLVALTTLLWLSHLFTFALFAGVIGWVRLFETKSLKRAFVSALAVTWPGWLLTADYLVLSSQASWIDREDTSWNPILWTIEYFGRQYFHTVSNGAYIVALAAWGWIVALILWSWRRSGRSLKSTVVAVLTNPISSVILFLFVSYLALPYKALGWHKVNSRLIPFILGLTLAAVAAIPGFRLSAAVQKAFTASIVIAMLAIAAFITPEVRRMDDMVTEYLSGMEKFEPNSRLLAIHHENPPFGGIRPVTRAHEYYHIAKGGVNGKSIPYMNTLSVMWYRSYPVDDTFPEFDPHDPDRMRQAYDYILVFGNDSGEVEASVEDMGFKNVHRQGRLKLFRQAPSTAAKSTVTSSIAGAGSR